MMFQIIAMFIGMWSLVIGTGFFGAAVALNKHVTGEQFSELDPVINKYFWLGTVFFGIGAGLVCIFSIKILIEHFQY